MTRLNTLAARPFVPSFMEILKGTQDFMKGHGSAASSDSLREQNGRSVSNFIKQLTRYDRPSYIDSRYGVGIKVHLR